jgi:hypothetical protein
VQRVRKDAWVLEKKKRNNTDLSLESYENQNRIEGEWS